MMIIQEIKACR